MEGQEKALVVAMEEDPAPACEKDPLPLEFQEPDAMEGVEPEFISHNVTSNDDQRAHAPPAFMNREAYMKLNEKGWTYLPNATGVGLHYHSKSQQWHSSWPTGNKAPTWGALRSEEKAILTALIALWTWFCAECAWCKPKDRAYLLALQAKCDEIPF